MQININGESRELTGNMTIAQLLDELNIARRFLAVERNKEIVPKSAYERTELQPGDVLEIVTMVGGG